MTIKQRRDEVLEFLRSEFELKTQQHDNITFSLKCSKNLEQFLRDMANNITQGFIIETCDDDEHASGREVEEVVLESIPQPVEDELTAPIPHMTLAEISDRWQAGDTEPPINVTERPTKDIRHGVNFDHGAGRDPNF